MLVRDMSQLWGPGLSFRGNSLPMAVIINKDRLKTTCPVPECGKEFAFDGGETRVFEVPPFLIRASPFLSIRTAISLTLPLFESGCLLPSNERITGFIGRPHG
jgi:hypothetical protein